MKGAMVPQFSVGQQVLFTTGPKECRRQDAGRIVKLHKSGRAGSAEIRTLGSDGLPSRLTRSLRFVTAL